MFERLFGRKSKSVNTPNTKPDQSDHKEQPLLNELEDLQQALHASPSIDPNAIPILDDIIESGSGKETKRELLEECEHNTSEAPSQSDEKKAAIEQQVDQLVQELVNELMPGLEAELRQRLLALAPQYLKTQPQED